MLEGNPDLVHLPGNMDVCFKREAQKRVSIRNYLTAVGSNQLVEELISCVLYVYVYGVCVCVCIYLSY